MTEREKTEYISARVTEDEKKWCRTQADQLGIGEGALLRMLISRVRDAGDGDAIKGLARFQQSGLEFSDTESNR